ncbi:hypothetical protein DFJ77DRAFT_475392 [Powellomyces hirtus]|nr:hypothetical protein DFJ77DRAFT_475392 [Powellomyces hirtus]
MPGTLLPEDENFVRKAVSGGQVLSSTAARLYFAQHGSWNYTGKVGALALSRAGAGSFRLYLVDVNSGATLWQHDVSDDVKYRKDKPFFHSFVGSEALVGLSFADEDEAAEFYDAYNDKESASPAPSSMPAQPPMTLPRAQPAIPTSAAPQPPMPMPRAQPAIPAAAPMHVPAGVAAGIVHSSSTGSLGGKKEADSPRSSVFGGSLRSKKTTKGDKKKGGFDKSMISAPTNFQHITHVGYNQQTGFTAKNIPVEWKAIFAKAGITEEQLQDPETVKTVKKFMKQHKGDLNKQAAPAVVAPTSAPPAIPSSAAGGRRAPPPPPPKGRTAPPAPPRQQPETPPRATPGPPAAPPRGPPVIPARTDHEAPAGRAVPPPPPPAPPMGGGGGGPPPPPPPPAPGAGGPPPPPPRAPDIAAAPATPARPIAGAAPVDLLASIRQAGGIGALKATSKEERQPADSGPVDTGNALADLLRNQLALRKNKVGDASDSDEDEESDDEWD